MKERLVGAAVLMAAAIILIPEMLSGPDRHAATQPQAAPSESSIKTYTIDLSASPGTQAATSSVEDNRAPPPEESASTAEPAAGSATEPGAEPASASSQVNPESAVESGTASGASESVASEPSAPVDHADERAAEPAVSQPPTQAAPVAAQPPKQSPEQSPAPLASSPAAPTSGGWVVQVGSFSKQATAQRLMSELRGQGRDAFVMPVRSGAATLYRVRIGPFKERAGAEAALRAVKSSMPGAAVVAHP